jgi:exonuclease SbcC
VKILAIRGRNLASLAGDFELDLQTPPFDRAGLFAITGPVGAGKSTLLDAMCLALFDRTPRLTGRGGAAVGSPEDEEALRLGSNDVRTVLRRGAVDGYAEVDFRGRDGKSYRARWSVRRARRRVDGRLQPQQMALRELDSEQILHGDRKQETLAAIEEKLGLSFDQFRRSVMLAQGDFAAFLNSGPKDRAELLERVTGTEIYRRISQRAYVRRGEEEHRLTVLQESANTHTALGQEDREQLERRATQATADLEMLVSDEAAAEKAWRWHRAFEQLTDRENQARRSYTRAKAAWTSTADRRQELSTIQVAQPLRPMLEVLDRSKKEFSVTLAEHADCAKRLNGARLAELDCARAAEMADIELQKVDARQRELATGLSRARELDILLAEARKALGSAETQSQAAAAGIAELAAKVKGMRAELEDSLGLESRIREFLDQHRDLERLVPEWDRCESDLGRVQRILGSMKRIDEQRAGLTRQHEEDLLSLRAARAEVAQRHRELTQVRTETERARKRAQASGMADLRHRQKTCREQRAVLEDVRQTGSEIRDLSERASGLDAQLHKARDKSVAAAAEAEVHARTLQVVSSGLEEARRALVVAERAMSLADHRMELRDGEPCPLCGSTHHPCAQFAFGEVLVQQRERVHELAEQQESLSGFAIRSRAAQASWDERANAAAQDVDQVTVRLRQLVDGWKARREKSAWGEFPENLLTDGVDGMLEQRIVLVDQSIAELDLEQERAEALLSVSQAAEVALQDAQISWLSAGDAVKAAEQAERRSTEALSETDSELRRLDSIRGEILAGLASPFRDWQGWQKALEEDPERFSRTCRDQVGDWLDRAEQMARIQTRSVDLKRQLADQETVRRERDALGRELGVRAAEHRRRLQDLEKGRGDVLDGRATVDVERELSESMTSAGQRREQCAGERQRAQVKHAEATVRFQHASEARERARRAVEEAEGRLGCAAESAEIPLQDLEARLGHDGVWIRAREKEFAVKRQDLERVETILGERSSQRQHHESNGRPSLGADQAVEVRTLATAALTEANEAVAQLRLELARDDEARKRLAELRPRVAAQVESLETWQALAELIGSARGDRFQVFAQSLTLDALLARANHHLAEVARRYLLVRIPGTDLDLQIVDQEMGDSARSIHSLSGGESFLVSLAMALGLSSLSAQRTRVETLFIDEGLGTLDPLSLEAALSALDALQATGRQVGIISHVEGLAERIGVHVEVVPTGRGRSQLRLS